MRRLLVAVLVIGSIFNFIGWAANVFVQWVREAPPALPPTGLELVSHFGVALAWCLVYRLSSPSWGGSKMQLALVSAGIVLLGGTARDLMLLSGGSLRPGISGMTTLVALAAFVLVAPLLPRLLPEHVFTPT